MEFFVSEWVHTFKIAQENLEKAKKNLKEGMYQWAYLKARSSVVDALKAFLQYYNTYTESRNLVSLLRELEVHQEVPKDIFEYARFLEGEFVNATAPMAQSAIIQAEKIVMWVKDHLLDEGFLESDR